MDLNEFVRLLRRRWALILTVTLVGVLGAAILSLSAARSYVATTKVFVSVQSAGDSSASDLVQGSSAAQAKVRSYVDVVTSASVLGPVIDELHLDETPAELASRVSAAASLNTVLITIAVSDADPARAAAIANAVGASLGKVVVNDLETPPVGSSSLVKIATIDPARAPESPASPKVLTNLALGVLLGLLAGVGLAVLGNRLDTRIHGAADVEGVTSTPVLGGIGFDPEARARPLIVHADPRSPRAESFRALRTNLQFLDLDAATRSFVVTSALPSEGKSTTTANLAIALAESGSSVVLVDGDLRRPRTAEIMGLEGAVGLTNVLIGQAELEDVLQPWGRGSLNVLPAGSIPPNPSELLGSPGMKLLLQGLTEKFDYVLIDAPPLLPVTDAAILSKFTSGALVVCAAKISTRNQLKTALSSLDNIGSRTLGMVMTMLPTKGPNAYGYGAYDRYYGAVPDTTTDRNARGSARRARRVES